MHVRPAVAAPAPAGGEARSVFLDPSGRRWRRASRLAAVVGAAVLVPALVAVLAATAPPLQPSGGAGVSAADVGPEAATVGEGPLVRVVRVDGAVLRDPFSDEVVAPVTPEQQEELDGSRYALQYYGYADRRSTISLTFDDGPDPRWTPAVLDLLSAHSAQATFFAVGERLAHDPEIAERAHREGHLVANHTSTHPDLASIPAWKQRWELVTTDRAIRQVTGSGSAYVRLPYDGGDGQEFVSAVLSAQRLGYTVSTYDFDSMDWHHVGDPDAIELPELDGRPLTVLVHDAGGDRSATLAYLERLLPAAEAAGYTFTTLETSQPVPAQAAVAGEPVGPLDQVAALELRVLFAWPDAVLRALFVLALASVALVGAFQLALGVARHRRRRTRLAGLRYDRPVDVVIAAYDEEQVIARTLTSVLASTQLLGRVIVVDDGSTDGTAAAVERVRASDPRVVLVSQANRGKSAALNHGLRLSRAEVVVTLDADTVILPTTVERLVRHFGGSGAEELGAVAGTVKVGNRTRNLLTRWQALEYLVQIGVERAAQDALGAISIVPGACAAWRRTAVLEAGGYSHDTLAEDCDLSLTLHRLGHRVTQDDEGVAFTEAPDTVDALLKQRTRWMFGTMQAVVKHRSMVLDPRHGWLGMFVLPAYVLSIVVPLVFLPLIVVMAVSLVSADGLGAVLPYAVAFMAVQVVVSAVAVRMMGEDCHHLWVVPLYRLAYEPLRAYLLYTSALTAVRGVSLGWNKLSRTGVLDAVPAPRAVSVEVPGEVPVGAPVEVVLPETRLAGRTREEVA